MKRFALLVAVLALFGGSFAHADSGTSGQSHSRGNFWKNEGDRSGVTKMKGFNPMAFFKNQEEKYKERKALGQTR